jgi:hypothetical protein
VPLFATNIVQLLFLHLLTSDTRRVAIREIITPLLLLFDSRCLKQHTSCLTFLISAILRTMTSEEDSWTGELVTQRRQSGVCCWIHSICQSRQFVSVLGCLSVCFSVWLTVSLSGCLTVCLSVCLCAHLPLSDVCVCLSTSLGSRTISLLSVCAPICLLVLMSVCFSAFLYLSVYVCLYVFVGLSVRLRLFVCLFQYLTHLCHPQFNFGTSEH